ncbi:MAG: single-stranded DNA-binding protein [Oscillospiraceae bacterium]
MYNHTGLQGRLTADPELRYTQQGTAITSFTLASDTGRKTKDGKKITNFIECVAWRAQAEFVCKYLSKGRLVLVEGELTSRSYSGMAVRDHTQEVHVMGSDEIHIYHAAVVHDNNRETVSIGTDAAVISD